jgi:periplasmic protein TonB
MAALAVHAALIVAAFECTLAPKVETVGEDGGEFTSNGLFRSLPTSPLLPTPVVPPPQIVTAPLPVPAQTPPPLVTPATPVIATTAGSASYPIRTPAVVEKPRRTAAKIATTSNSSTTAKIVRTGATASGGIAAAGKGETSGIRYLYTPHPPYPPQARALRQQGVVVIEAEINPSGRVANASILRSSGFRVLDEAALAAVRAWTFEPAREAGIPVAVRAEIPVRFSLSD